MKTTTIKVGSTLRDRLAALARDRGTTMGALLSEATDRMEREAFFTRARAQLAQFRDENPAGWDSDRTESHSWQMGTDRDAIGDGDEPGWWE